MSASTEQLSKEKLRQEALRLSIMTPLEHDDYLLRAAKLKKEIKHHTWPLVLGVVISLIASIAALALAYLKFIQPEVLP